MRLTPLWDFGRRHGGFVAFVWWIALLCIPLVSAERREAALRAAERDLPTGFVITAGGAAGTTYRINSLRGLGRLPNGGWPPTVPPPPPPGVFPDPLVTKPSWSTWNSATGEYDGDPFTGNGLPAAPDATTYYTGNLRQVSTPAAYIAAIAASSDRDIVEYTTDLTLTGANLIVPKRFDHNTAPNGKVLIRGANFAKTLGDRVDPTDFATVPRLKFNPGNNNYAMSFAAGASGHHFRGCVFENVTNSSGSGDCLGLFWWAFKVNATGGPQQQTSDMPRQLICEQNYFLNDWTSGGARWCRRAMTLDGRYAIVRQNYMQGFIVRNGTGDGQCIHSLTGLGDWLIEDNYCEGSTEIIMFGGSTVSMGNQAYGNNVIIRRNYLTRQLAWLTDASTKNVMKNLFELKFGQFVVVDSNYMSNNNGASQQQDMVLKCAPHAGEAGFLVTMHVRVCRNYTTNGVGAFEIDTGDSGLNGPPNYIPVTPVQYLQIDGNAFVARYNTSAGVTINKFGGFADTTHVMRKVWIDHNWFEGRHSFVYFTPPVAQHIVDDFQLTNNINATPFQYAALFSDNGIWHQAMLNAYVGAGTALVKKNVAIWTQGGSAANNLWGTTGTLAADNIAYSAVATLTAKLNGDNSVKATATDLYQAGTDGKDIGPDWSRLAAALAATT